VTLTLAALLLLVALGAAAYRRSAGVAPRRAAGEGVLFAAAVALVYWMAFVRHGPTPWWEEDRRRRAAAPAGATSADAPAPSPSRA
jgi:hypothetical protein